MVRELVKVLLVEDDRAHAQLVKLSLGDADLTAFQLEHVECLADARERLEKNRYDVVLLDLGLPDARGFEAILEIRNQFPEISVVILTANSDPRVGIEAASAGAHYCIYKGELSVRTVERALRYAVHHQQMLLQLRSANESLDRKNEELQETNDLLDQRNNQLQSTNDMLDQKNARLAQLCETAQQFVDNVSHEFRTPLTVIKEYASIIRDGLVGQVTQQQREFLDIVNDRTDDLAIMIDDMLDVSKLEAGLLSVCRREAKVSDVFGHVLPMLGRKATVKKMTLETSLEEDLPMVYCDPEKVGRVIINLATNAIKFSEDGGSVRVWARQGKNQSEIEIGVTDDGLGIRAEDLQLIFERFRQLEDRSRGSTKGFGLGLDIARELVRRNLGEINVESELGKGSTFWFSVPVWDPAELAARYLERIERSDCRQASLALLVATIDLPLRQAVSNVVDEFLQHTFRGDDLPLRIVPSKWLVFTQCPQCEVDKMLDRVHTVWAETNRNMPGEKLPEITLRLKGVWPAETAAEELLVAFRSELVSMADEPERTRVLLVDDDHELVIGLGMRLRAAGYEVATAFNGKSAVDSAVAHRPDAILMDNYMPVMGGIEALEELRKHPETMDLPVIMLSASLRDQQKALDEGAFFLQKPCDANTIVTALREVIAEPCLAGLTKNNA